MQTEQEMWKLVVGWEGQYEVSSLGRVRSLLSGKRKILQQELNRSGYLRTYLTTKRKYYSRNRKSIRTRSKHVFVHRLVLEAFVGPCPPGMESLHGNDISADNRIENLRWDTRLNNKADQRKNHNEPEPEEAPF